MKKRECKTMVLVGNILIDPEILRKCLKKTCYYLNYDPENELIDFWINDGNGKETIFEIRNASLENAQKLARELGLKSDDDDDGLATMWSKYNPRVTLHDDGSPEADVLRIMMLKASLPFDTHKAEKLSVSLRGGIYKWTFEELKKVIQDEINRNLKELASTP